MNLPKSVPISEILIELWQANIAVLKARNQMIASGTAPSTAYEFTDNIFKQVDQMAAYVISQEKTARNRGVK